MNHPGNRLQPAMHPYHGPKASVLLTGAAMNHQMKPAAVTAPT